LIYAPPRFSNDRVVASKPISKPVLLEQKKIPLVLLFLVQKIAHRRKEFFIIWSPEDRLSKHGLINLQSSFLTIAESGFAGA
ncbi:MAG TPA: hypothetical protein VK731_09590, partial [Candidatus Cybelea sp.]|nr:hypothetical protein [Candidatus Cybelea sp.]